MLSIQYQAMREKEDALKEEKAEYKEKHIEPAKKEMAELYARMLNKVIENDELKGENVKMPNAEMKVFENTLNVYGSGKKVFIDLFDTFWIFNNNSMDGDDWSRNHINDSGTGFACNVEVIMDELNRYLKLEEKLEIELEKFNKIYSV